MVHNSLKETRKPLGKRIKCKKFSRSFRNQTSPRQTTPTQKKKQNKKNAHLNFGCALFSDIPVCKILHHHHHTTKPSLQLNLHLQKELMKKSDLREPPWPNFPCAIVTLNI